MLPILYQSHDLILYSYPLLMGIGWGVAYQIYFSYFNSSSSRLKGQILFWGVFLSAWIGSKALFLLTYPGQTDFAGELSFWTGGGFVFYGGLLAGGLFLFIFRLFDKSLSLKDLWPMIPSLAIGHAIGRVGCFLAGCCFGKPTNFFWAVFMHDHYRHPTQLIEAIGLLFIGLHLLRSKTSHIVLMSRYLLLYGALRFFVEALRGDGIRGSWGPLTPSQWISLFLIFSGLVTYFRSKYRVLDLGRSN